MTVAAVLVTRGNVPMEPVLGPYQQLGIETVVWDNSRLTDVQVLGRYAGISLTDAERIIVQDDDCVLTTGSVTALIEEYLPGVVVCNMPDAFRGNYPDSGLVGFGAIFDRGLPQRAFGQFQRRWGNGYEALFRRECDAVLTALTPCVWVDLEYRNREFASDPDRLWRQPDHFANRQRVLKMAREVRWNVQLWHA